MYNREPSDFTEIFDYTNFAKLKNMWAFYIGEFNENCYKYHGVGTLYLTNGEIIVGNF